MGRQIGALTLAELGFVVVQIDGMGTNWRSRAFHAVCWKNVKDSGFPDRIAWMRAAVAAGRSWMDLSRVGIYGGSAGGQNALGALLHHGDFYKAAAPDGFFRAPSARGGAAEPLKLSHRGVQLAEPSMATAGLELPASGTDGISDSLHPWATPRR